MYLWKKTATAAIQIFFLCLPVMWIPCTRLRHFQHVTSIMWEVPLISASDFLLSQQSTYSCVWFLRWLIPLAVPALLGRYIGQDVLRPRPPSIRPGCILALGWDKMGVTTGSFMLCFHLERNPCAQSQQVQSTCESLQPGWLRGRLEGHLPCCMGKSPASCSLLPTCWNSLVTWSGTISALAQTRLSQLL